MECRKKEKGEKVVGWKEGKEWRMEGGLLPFSFSSPSSFYHSRVIFLVQRNGGERWYKTGNFKQQKQGMKNKDHSDVRNSLHVLTLNNRGYFRLMS